MRVLLINSSECVGGAAVAARRLLNGLNKQGVKAKLLVKEKLTDKLTVIESPFKRRAKWSFLWERGCIFLNNRFSKKNLFAVDIANVGVDITTLEEFKEADIIHLHWINQGFLSLKQIEKILATGKPIVWTMHDMWPFTGICHHARQCNAYQSHCGCCPYLISPSKKDLSFRVFHRKQDIYQGRHLSFIACSHWLGDLASKSALIGKMPIYVVPNPIDTHLFMSMDKRSAREKLQLPLGKKLILFGSVNTQDPRKGVQYLIEACHKLVEKGRNTDNVEVICFGKGAEHLQGLLPFKVNALGYISDEKKIVEVYNAADLFVTPSLEENLPNMIMESMACGTPAVGFKVGGIPEMIDHLQTGFVVDTIDAEALAEGIWWVLNEADASNLQKNCIHKVLTSYSELAVCQKIIGIYKKISGKNV